ncbi:MAG: hypothetical protein K5786_05325, partial [Treponema sp.]|nr:hypothetical protein [Treponema sp.]
MLFLIFTGAGTRGGLLWADQTLAGPISLTDGQTYQLTEKTTVTGTVTITGNVTIDLNGFSLTIGTLYLGGERTGPDSSLTFNSTNGSGTVTVTTYDVANNADTTLTVGTGVTLILNGNYYLNTDTGKETKLTINGNLILGENAAPYTDGGGTYNLEDSIDPNTPIEVTYETSDYYWTGNANDNYWQNSENWTADSAGTKKVKTGTYPGCKDNESAHFESDYANDITNFSLTGTNLSIINNASISFASDISAATITNTGSLTVTDITSCTSLTNNGGTITADSITATSVFSNSLIKTKDLNVNDIIKFGDASTKAGSLEITGNGTLNVTSGTTYSFFNDIVIDNGANLTLASDIIVYGNWTNDNASGGLSAGTSKVTFAGSGKTVSGENTFGDVTISGITTFSDSNNFANFISTSSGTTLTFGDGKTQTVNGKLTLTNTSLSGNSTFITQGTSASHFSASSLTIDSNIKIKTASDASVVGGQFDITDSGSTITSGSTNSAYATAFKNGWKLGSLTFTWTGSTSTDWNTATNWDIGIIPGGTYTSDASVIIPNTTNKAELNLSSDMTIKSLSVGSSTSQSNAKLTLAGSNNLTLTAASSPLTIYGTVNYSGSGRILDSTGSAINDITHDGTVEYSGSAQTITDYGDTDYSNLIVSGSASSSTDLKVSGTFKNSGTTSLANTATFTGAVTNTGTLTLSDSTLTAAGNWTNTGTFN